MRGKISLAMSSEHKMEQRALSLELARAAADGDRSARRQLVLSLIDKVGTTVRCLNAGDPNTEDYIQDVLIEILNSVGSYRGESSIESWAERITVRVALRKIKQKNWRAKIVLLDSSREGIAIDLFGDDAIVKRQIWDRIIAALEKLDSDRRTVVVLQLVLGHTTAEIAHLTQTKFNTVKDRLAKGRELLRQELLRDSVLDDLLENYRRGPK